MKTSDKFVAALTDWSERVAERGKGSGNIIKERQIITMDKMNLILANEIYGRPPVGYKFCTKIGQFIDTIWQETRVPRNNTIDLLNKGLAVAFNMEPVNLSEYENEKARIDAIHKAYAHNFEILFP